MEIRRLLKNGLFSATLLGCGLLHGHYKFCPNCGHCLRPPCPPSRFSPPSSCSEASMREGNCPCAEDFKPPKHYHHFREWRKDFCENRDPWVEHDGCFNTEEHSACHHHSKKWHKHSPKDRSHCINAGDPKKDSKGAKHRKHSKKGRWHFSMEHLEAPLPESAPEAQING